MGRLWRTLEKPSTPSIDGAPMRSEGLSGRFKFGNRASMALLR